MSLSDYFRQQAEWRQAKADEYPDDVRNAQSAAALSALADYVAEDRTAESPAVAALEPHLLDDAVLGGEQTRRTVSRYGYEHVVKSERQHEAFLDELAVVALEDAYRFATDHDGDDPTGVLFDFERAAARERVFLPRPYFERRGRSTEQELAAWVSDARGEDNR